MTATQNTNPQLSNDERAQLSSKTRHEGELPSIVDMHRAQHRREPLNPGMKIASGAVADGPFRPSVSLHPGNVEALSDEHKDLLASATSAFDTACKGLEQVAKARTAANSNEAWTAAQRLLQVGKLAEQTLERATKSFDTAHKQLNDFVTALDKNLSAPLDGLVSATLAQEIRSYVRNLPDDKRSAFVTEALKKGDKQALGALLSAPGYLCGLSEIQQKHYLRQFHETSNPVAVARLAVAKRALELIETRAALVLTEAERAMGGTFKKLKAIRDANNSAEQAVLMQNGLV
ncbi:MAG: hypothetical protein R3E75_11590 [Steroidobacteraceae bacterium]|nr:hypothetical protein [Nevskiaceae bacterium]MCP5359711.1 hypothetical protein [Nevskiaceae bacterium]MCP5472799.1 hypothetical protein [Nevskiaceae bacterium]